eukprot:5004112-Prymnesium_polylepis.1
MELCTVLHHVHERHRLTSTPREVLQHPRSATTVAQAATEEAKEEEGPKERQSDDEPDHVEPKKTEHPKDGAEDQPLHELSPHLVALLR